ncbi:PP2C family protein-serine/threonine phosphatase [Kineococcus sp. SYSU DK001]|uniref:PP2C family protein-serine/threonine phosphatase n=1 Tax=Kineococcus sp. SYSU DK001 TaxID=3383122 RepID=UPI003D7DB2F3
MSDHHGRRGDERRSAGTPGDAGTPPPQRELDRADYAALFDVLPTPCLVVDAHLRVVTTNTAHERTTGRRREDVRGLPLLQAFPDVTPGRQDGTSELEQSLDRVLRTGRPDALPLARYDLPDDRGVVRERWWSALHLPVLDADGDVTLIVQRVEDVTTYVQRPVTPGGGTAPGGPAPDPQDTLTVELTRLHTVVADLYARGQELRDALDAEATASARLQSLVQVALQMGTARDVAELTDVIVHAVSTVLGADEGAVAVTTEGNRDLELVFSTSVGEEMRDAYPRLPLTAPLPVSVAAATGRAVVLADEDTCRAWSPELSAAIDLGDYRATVALPLRSGEEVLGALSISWRREQDFDQRDRDLMDAFAAQCAQTLQRLRAQERERRAAAAERRLSETLQRSLLTRPAQPDQLQIAVRYLPAAARARIGGDWYDSFLAPTGDLTLVIGDVAGHDRDAAAAMAQVRNLLRGVAQTLRRPPAALLTGLDRAMRTLEVQALTTTVLAQVHQTPEQATRGVRTLHWSNAGHPPPLLLDPDGDVRLLETEPDLFLGLDPATPRHDHAVDLLPHATVVLYTDGLVERRGAGLQEGLTWLCERVRGQQHRSAEDLCEHVLADLGRPEDDIALLVLKAHLDDGSTSAVGG